MPIFWTRTTNQKTCNLQTMFLVHHHEKPDLLQAPCPRTHDPDYLRLQQPLSQSILISELIGFSSLLYCSHRQTSGRRVIDKGITTSLYPGRYGSSRDLFAFLHGREDLFRDAGCCPSQWFLSLLNDAIRATSSTNRLPIRQGATRLGPCHHSTKSQ